MTNPGANRSRVDRVIRIVASSPVSWADAARTAIDEASKTIQGLTVARLIDNDLLVRENATLYRVKLELQFQLDRSRTDDAGAQVEVRRYLIVANQTLANASLQQVVHDRRKQSAAEFHVLVPVMDPNQAVDRSGFIRPNMQTNLLEGHALALSEAEQRLESFKLSFADLGNDLTAETATGGVIPAIRRVMERSSFDEIIISTLPAGISRWLKLDLPTRIERTFDVPITALVQQEPAGAGDVVREEWR